MLGGFAGIATFSMALSCAISYAATDLSIHLSLRRGRLDVPNERSLHSRPVPRLGGIGILVGFLVPIAVLYVTRAIGLGGSWVLPRATLIFTSAAIILGGAGLYDDLHILTALQKFTIQSLFALAIAVYGLRFATARFEFHDSLWAQFFRVFLALLWLVTFTNFYNFMDGVNGMAGCTGVIYGCFLSYFAWQQSQPGICVIAILSAGASLGFLFHNFPRARTFMGDAGSLFLGMLFALLAWFLYEQSNGRRMLVPLLLLYSTFIYDCTLTLVRRLLLRENIFRAHRSHIYQRLVKQGWSHPGVTLLYASLHVLGGGLGVVYLRVSGATLLTTVGVMAILLTALAVLVSLAERKHVPFQHGTEGGSAAARL
jgi:UDP-N-acetylmuramyl pentapeptide phosphotransferase/UDP-N-acetylglucosamine-1-phosphate transferase